MLRVKKLLIRVMKALMLNSHRGPDSAGAAAEEHCLTLKVKNYPIEAFEVLPPNVTGESTVLGLQAGEHCLHTDSETLPDSGFLGSVVECRWRINGG